MPNWMKKAKPAFIGFAHTSRKRHMQTAIDKACQRTEKLTLDGVCSRCGTNLVLIRKPDGEWLRCVKCHVQVKVV